MRGVRFRLARLVLATLLLGATVATVAPPASADIRAVAIKDNFYKPAKITIPKGTKVKWTNRGDNTHTVSKKGGGWSSGFLTPGETFSKVFKIKGTIKYFCKVHPNVMLGTIVVT